MKLKTTALVSLLLSSVFMIGLVGCDKQETPEAPTLSALQLPSAEPSYGSAAVHDPSIFYDEASSTYYAFGSHFAVGKSTDLIKWEQVFADNESASNGLYGETPWRDVLVESTKLVGDGMPTTWAPDVEVINGKYYMYYSLTKAFGSPISVIGRVSSDNVLGPYSNEEIIVYSQGKSGEPNCIDPELFYDKEGRLWMVFGSWNGGIFVKELYASGENAGLPIESDPTDHGTLVWKKGASSGVEGPYIFYNEELDYYYLMVSEGDLSTVYNMRIARSKNPDGPYEDITGKDVVNGGGNKLAGNYQFMDEKIGYAAMGHNSVIKKDGKYLVVYHTRFRSGTSGVTANHSLYVNQLYFNEDGWPVLSPSRYTGEEKGSVVEAMLYNNFQIVVHKTATVVDFAESVLYTFGMDKTITDESGTAVGSWSLKDGYYVTVTLNDIEYKGVVCAGWRNTKDGRSGGAINITATSAEGGPLWAQATI